MTFYNNVLSADQVGSSAHPSIQLRTANDDSALAIYLRQGRSNIEVSSRSDSTVTFNDTGVSWGTKDWRTVTFEIDTTNELVNVYINGQRVLENLSIAGNSDITKVRIGGQLPTAGTSFIVDNFGFYTSSPIPEPSTVAALLGLAVLG